MADPKEPSDTGTVIADAKDAFPDCPASATQQCNSPAKKPAGKVRRCVTQIKATTGGTKGVRKVNNKAPERPDNVLTPSSSPDKNFQANKPNEPVVLIRGCQEVMLEAITTPPHTAVAWSVEANHTKNPPPEIVSNANKATLKTNVEGSFSVIATLDGCKVVWNVIFVWVKVDVTSSKGPKPTDHYADNGSSPSNFRFRSGKFSVGEYAWEDQVNVKLIGGGDDQKAGVQKVNLYVLQNGIFDAPTELTAHYAAPPPMSTAREKPPGGWPALDGTDEGTFVTDPAAFQLTGRKGDVDFTVWIGDSPGGEFDQSHQVTKKPLTSVSGGIVFDTAIAAVSDDALNGIVVCAHTKWSADFSGVADAKGNYVPRGAKTTPGIIPWTPIPADGGGQDAGEAGMETMGQTFGSNPIPDFDWTPSH